MRRAASKRSHSWWWDSHISPKNSKWLAENLEGKQLLALALYLLSCGHSIDPCCLPSELELKVGDLSAPIFYDCQHDAKFSFSSVNVSEFCSKDERLFRSA